jgi:hypothetical protein
MIGAGVSSNSMSASYKPGPASEIANLDLETI